MKTEYKTSPAQRAYANAYYAALQRTASRSTARREARTASKATGATHGGKRFTIVEVVQTTKPNGKPTQTAQVTITLPLNVVEAYITNLLKREVGAAPQGD